MRKARRSPAWLVAAAFSVSLAGCGGDVDTGEIPLPEIDYTREVLDNGLTVIVHEDHQTPVVAVNVWYHVGGKNEPKGKSGFAHLFEHLMFNGSEHYEGEFFRPFEQAGATDMNGTTNQDRTNYFETVPRPALDMALWMESDRMGHLLGAITQGKLDEQRGVVKNEKRQRENVPYGEVWEKIAHNTYPEEHPYHSTVIGSMEDLNAAGLEDVKQWFRDYYGAANAVVVIAGDVETKVALEKARRYFGGIDSGPPVTQPGTWIAELDGPRRMKMQDRVAQARLYKVWNVPEWGAPDADYLRLAARVLAGGKSSPLYKRLVYDERLATDVNVMLDKNEMGSQVLVRASARKGVKLATLEAAIEEELDRFRRLGPTPAALERARTGILSGFIKGIERVGGFGGKSDILAESEVYGGSPDAWRESLTRIRDARPADVREAARRWLDDGVFTLEVHPFAEHSSAATEVDRSRVPGPGKPADLELPELQRAELDNGLQVILAERHEAPVVNFRMIFDAGYAADASDRPGLSSLTMAMLDEGTQQRSALEISDAERRLGASISAGSDLDTSTVSLSALASRLGPSLDLYADVIRNPSFPESDLERIRQQRLAAIRQEKTDPMSLGLRVLPPLLYGRDHAYSQPLTGTGTLASVRAMTAEELDRFHRRWLRPDRATLVVVGDTTLEELMPKLREAFGDWRSPGEDVGKRIHEVAADRGRRPRVYLMNRPDAEQSIVFAGQLAPPKSSPQDIPLMTANRILGGMFTSRLNMNLREQKHWAYGARSALVTARGQRPLILYAPVQKDKTAPAIREILAEVRGIRGDRPIRPEELKKAQNSLTRSLPGQNETSSGVAASIDTIVTYDLPDDYYDRFVDRVLGLELGEVRDAARELVNPEQLVWVVVGDLAAIEDDVRALDLGPVQVLDASGDPVTEDSDDSKEQ